MLDEKKVVFLELNSSYSHSMPGYCLIRALAEREAPEWSWGHSEATAKTSLDEIVCDVEANNPDVLLATGYIFNLDLLLKVCTELKKRNKGLKIFLGGPSFLGDNEHFLRENLCISGVIRGDESSIPDLLKGNDFKQVAGLCYLNEQNCYQDNKSADYKAELDTLPSPYQHALIHRGKAFYQLETSRGCGGACTFCTSSKSKRVKYHSLPRVKKDLQSLHDLGYRDIRLIDRTFNEDSARAVSMLKFFAEDFPDMRFHLEIHPGRLRPEVLEQLAKAEKGSLHLEAGIQSFDPTVLKKIRRPASAEKTEKSLKALLALDNLELHTDLIAGLPGQTLASLLSDVNKMLELAPDEIQLENLKLLPGTELRENPPPGLEYSPEIPWQVTRTNKMSVKDLEKASLYSYILDSWYNPPGLRNVFRFSTRQSNDFFIEFCDFIEPYCDLSKGKLAMEKRFDLLEEFLEEQDEKSLELCRFAKIACGFRCDKADMQKYSKSTDETVIWSRAELDKNTAIKRCIKLDCSFNAADFWLNPKAKLHESPTSYIFKLHYGRNVANVVKRK
ncbi:MAG: DUF4080 domain-containing protein [Victivallaceae bacterium]|nr:DUF4080 domain-containing protein [Victivallaceae bacterium]